MIPALIGLTAGIAIGTIFGLWLARAPERECGEHGPAEDIDWEQAS